jgi:hypothetical protein
MKKAEKISSDLRELPIRKSKIKQQQHMKQKRLEISRLEMKTQKVIQSLVAAVKPMKILMLSFETTHIRSV